MEFYETGQSTWLIATRPTCGQRTAYWMDYRDWELYFKVSARRNFQRLDITPLQATNLKEQVISILRKKRMPKNRPATGDQSMGYR